MYIVLELDGKRYSINATEILPEAKAKKETVQERAAAQAAASAEAGPAGPGPEKAEIPAEPAKAPRKRGAAASTASAKEATAAAAPAPAPAASEAPATKPASVAGLPTPAQLDTYRLKYAALVKGLEEAGAGPRGDVPVRKRVMALLLNFAKTDSTEKIAVTQWDAFFAKTDAYAAGKNGLADLVGKLP